MNSEQLNYMAQALGELYFIDKDAKADELMEELVRVATQEGVPENELNAAKELYSKGKEDCDPISDTLRTELVDSCLDDLFSFIKANQGKPQGETAFTLYSTLLDHWMSIQAGQEEQAAEGEDEELNAEQEKCANCKWRTKKGQRCSNMVSGYYPDTMRDTEHCVEWEAAPAS